MASFATGKVSIAESLQMGMHKLLKQPGHEQHEAPSAGADIAALYLSEANRKKTLPAFFTLGRCELYAWSTASLAAVFVVTASTSHVRPWEVMATKSCSQSTRRAAGQAIRAGNGS